MGRSVSTGSKLFVSGSALAVSSVLLYALLQAGMVKDSIKPPGLEVSLPAPFALVFLVIISSGMGWAGWAFLSQARRLMYRLEFDVGIDTGTIKAVLAGSSLISASVLLVKSLCLFAFFSLGIATTNVWFPLSLLISVPYFLVVLSPRTRYFNPDNWSSASFSLLFRYPLNPKLQEIARKIRVGRESVIGVQPAKELGLCDPVKLWEGIDKLFSQTIPPALAIAVHTVIRKHGISLLIHWKLMEKTLDVMFSEIITKALNDFLEKELPEATSEARAGLKGFIMEFIILPTLRT